MKKSKRLWALLLTVAMIITYMPALAFAETEEGTDKPAEEVTEVVDNDAPDAEEAEEPAPAAEETAEAKEPAKAEKVEDPAKEEKAEPAVPEKPQAKEVKAPASGAPKANAEDGMCTVTYDAAGGYFWGYDEETEKEYKVSSWTETYEAGENCLYNYDPERGGYEFIGWTDIEGSVEILDLNEPYFLNNDLTLYAVWAERDTAVFDANGGYFREYGGDTIYYENVEEGEYAEGYIKPVHDGAYVFDGWSLKKNGSEVPYTFDGYLDYEISGNVTFYARWAPAWLVTFKANGGKFVDDNGEESATKVLKVSKTLGYLDSDEAYFGAETFLQYDGPMIFSHWTNAAGKRVDFDDNVSITADTEFTANWKQGYTLTFDAGDKIFKEYGSNEIKRYYPKNEYISDERFWSEDEYYVIGWKLDPSDEEPVDLEDYRITGDMTLYAVWGSVYGIDLHSGEGEFSIYWIDDPDIYHDSCVENETLNKFSNKPVNVNGTETTAYYPVYDNEQIIAPEGKIFEGWYYDEALTKPVLWETVVTSDFYDSLKDDEGKINLYAKYTDDYSELVLNTNGGELYGLRPDYTADDFIKLYCPRGNAFDLSNAQGEKYNEYGDRVEFVGWALDKAGTEAAPVSEDGYYIADSDTATFYAKWQEPLPDINLDLWSWEAEIYLDGDFEVHADVDIWDDTDLSELNYVSGIKVYDVTDEDDEDLEELDTVFSSTSRTYTVWNTDEAKITVHCAAIKTKLTKLYAELGKDLNLDNIRVVVYGEIKTSSGEVIDSAEEIFGIRDAFYDYCLDLCLTDYDYRLPDNKYEMLLGGDDNDGVYIDKDQWAKEYSSSSPDGDNEKAFKITKIESSSSAIKVDTYSDHFYIDPVSTGTATVTFTYKDVDGVTQTESFEITVVGSKYYVWVETDSSSDDDYETAVLKTVPGGTVELKANGKREAYNEDGDKVFFNNGFTFRWSFDDEILNDYATIEPLDAIGSKVKVTIDPEADPEDEALSSGISIKVEIIANEDGLARDESWGRINVYNEYYEIGGLPEKDEYQFMKKGETVTFTPEIRRFSPDTVSMTGGYEVVDDGVLIVRAYLDEDDNEAARISSSGGTLEPLYEDEVDGYYVLNGPLTIERLRDTSSEVAVLAVKDMASLDSDNYGYFDYDDAVASESIELEEIYDISKAKVPALKDLTYNGKTRKPEPSEVYMYSQDRYLWEYDEDEDWGSYTISYSNNKNVGLATVTLKGVRNAYGTKKITFKINPKATTMSKVTAGKKSFTAKWKKQATQTTGYEIQYALNSKFTKSAKKVKVTKNKTVKKTFKKLKGKKTYYVRIRTYKKIGTKYYYSTWSKTKKIKTKA